MNPLSDHPNAVAGGAGGISVGVIIVLVLHLFGVELDPYTAATITAVAAAAVLWFGRNGFDGIKRVLLHGNKEETPEPPVEPPAEG